MDSVRSGPFGQIFRPDNFVFGEPWLSAFEILRMIFDPTTCIHEYYILRKKRLNIATMDIVLIWGITICCPNTWSLFVCRPKWSWKQLGQGPLHRGSRAGGLCFGCGEERGREL
jgi:hypothetical protein